jgi:hypothetical protein
VPTYGRVHYDEVYPGVDLVYYGNQQRLEYDFVVAPGADPGAIALAFTGTDRVEVDARGDLVLHVAGGEIRQPRPFLYQEVGGARQEISGGYVLDAQHQVHFQVGAYDPSRPLVIDPVLAYSSYFGGSGYAWEGDKDIGNDIAVDAGGNFYVAGATNSLGWWHADAYVAKFDPTGSTLLYFTYLDGYGWDDYAHGLALDAAGNAYVTGELETWPLMLNAFAAKLSPTGNPYYYVAVSGYSGYDRDIGRDIGVDAAGNAYMIGETSASDFPITWGAFQPTYGGGLDDAFVVKLDWQGGLVYSTYLGGSQDEEGHGIAVDAAGNAYVTGWTESTNFPTTWGSFQPSSGGLIDAFVTKLDPFGSGLVYSSYLGGGWYDYGYGIAADLAGNVYVTGKTSSSADFPIWNAFQPTYGGYASDGFVTKVNAEGSALVYSSYLGGYSWDEGSAIAVDGWGNAYLTGYTNSSFDFPIWSAFQPVHRGIESAFVMKVGPAGWLIYSSYLSGSLFDRGLGIAVDAFANVYVTGYTTSADFPTTPDAFQPFNAGGECYPSFWGCPDAFVAKIVG